MGSAAARSIAGRGATVVAFERFDIGHSRGSSHGPARIFRFSYRDPQYVAMAQQALPLWGALEEEVGKGLLRTTGGLDMGVGINDNAQALSEHDAVYEILNGTEASRRWPSIKFDADDDVLYQPDAAVIAADRAWRSLADGARSRGAALEEHRVVKGLYEDSGRVVLAVDDEQIEAGACVVTAGAWAKPLLAGAGIDLDVFPSRETIVYLRGPALSLPIVEWGTPAAYALPSIDYGDDVIRAGFHIAGPATDPDVEGRAEPHAIDAVVEWASKRIRGVEPDPVAVETCIYTNTDDEHFVLERHGSIVVGSPCSGHGFKFAPLIGERLADLALN